MKKKILLIGNSVKTYILTKHLLNIAEVYVAPGNDLIKEFANCIDIRETSIHELLNFAMEADIDITILVDNNVLNSNIVDVFTNNNQQIFAPSLNASKIIYDKAFAKKVLYKLRIQTPKFGIFEKQNLVMDYIKNLKQPYVIKTNNPSSATIFTNLHQSKHIIESLFSEKNQKLIIEDYIWGTPFCFYTITDGYKAIPIGSSIIYKHSLEGNGGQLTNGMGACSPNTKLSLEKEYYLMDNVVYPTLEYLENNNSPYIGILGINGIISDDGNLQILGYQSFMQDVDCQTILNNIDEDILKLFQSCIIGSFSDEIDFINQKELSSVAITLTCKNKLNHQNIITGINNLDETIDIAYYPTVIKNKYLEYEANSGPVMVLTTSASTVSRASKKLYDELNSINFKGLYYRTDICNPQNIKY